MTTYNLQQHDGPVPDILEFQMPMCPGGAWPNTACEHAKLEAMYDAYEEAQREHARAALQAHEDFTAATAPPNGGPGTPSYAAAEGTLYEALAAAAASFHAKVTEIAQTYTDGVLGACCGE